jgi:hypothetical protein
MSYVCNAALNVDELNKCISISNILNSNANNQTCRPSLTKKRKICLC